MKIKLTAVAVFLLFYLFYFLSEWASVPGSAGYIYTMDDVYIHLQVAKNLAFHNMMSVNTDTFDSASSSPLYTFVLAFLVKVFGNWPYYPLIINFFFGLITTWLATELILKKFGKKAALISAIFLQGTAMVYMMSLISMEHTLHLFLMVVFAFLLFENEKRNFEGRFFMHLQLLIILNALVRFESIFLTVSVALVLLFKKKFSQSIAILFCGILPIVIFGLYSLDQGGMFFPNSIVLKNDYATEQGVIEFFTTIFNKGFSLQFLKDLFVPTVLCALYLVMRYKSAKDILLKESFLLVVFLMAYLHLFLGVLKYRYENYALLLLYFAMISPLIFFWRKMNTHYIYRVVFFSELIYLTVFCVYRFYYHNDMLINDSAKIYNNQVRLSKFLNRYYNRQTVIGNDIGAITYFNEIKLLDMYGLGSTEVAKFRTDPKNIGYDSKIKFSRFFENLADNNNASIAAIYPEWFAGEIPNSWKLAGIWPIYEGKEKKAKRFINFYAVSADEVEKLQKHLADFEKEK